MEFLLSPFSLNGAPHDVLLAACHQRNHAAGLLRSPGPMNPRIDPWLELSILTTESEGGAVTLSQPLYYEPARALRN